jgi:hypothetical protein
VAFVVRRRWQDALDNPSAGPAAQVTTRWHIVSLAVSAVLLVLAVVGVATA